MLKVLRLTIFVGLVYALAAFMGVDDDIKDALDILKSKVA